MKKDASTTIRINKEVKDYLKDNLKITAQVIVDEWIEKNIEFIKPKIKAKKSSKK